MGNLAIQRNCQRCQKPCPPQSDIMSIRDTVEGRSGRAAGHFDRPDPEEQRNAWNSDDEEFDEFGRKKKRKTSGSTAPKAVAAKVGGSALSVKQKAALERLQQKGAP